MSELRVGRRTLELSNEDKVLFPDEGLTKRDLVDHYVAVAEHVLRHVGGRPLTLHRFPDGIGEDGFYQKAVQDHDPEWIRRERVRKEGGSLEMVVAEDAATLAYLANQGAITLHAWLSRVDEPDLPDRLVFDFDPSTDDFDAVRFGAQRMRELLEDLGLATYPMVTGSRGMHVVCPLRREESFDDVRAFARGCAEWLAERHSDVLTTEQRKAKRGDRVFVDWLRNAYAQTAVVPYSVRARPGAPVATPLDWEEVERGDLAPDGWTLGSIGRRLGRKGDPWSGIARHARSLAAPREALDERRDEAE